MKPFHVNMTVRHIPEAVRFYTALFAAAPVVVKSDYANWMFDVPHINFAISDRGERIGFNHLGMQVESAEELAAMRAQLVRADNALIEQSEAACCHANSDKYWVTDPVGTARETFHTLGTIPIYGLDAEIASKPSACFVRVKATTTEKCCEPSVKAGASCCS